MPKKSDFRASSLPNLVEVLVQRAELHGDKVCLRYLEDGETEVESCTYAQLLQAASGIAAGLQAQYDVHDRIVLMLPNGIDYLKAFFGCLMARMIAVPAYPLSGNHNDARVLGMLQDCGARAILTSRKILQFMANKRAAFDSHEVPLDAILGQCLALENLTVAGEVYRPLNLSGNDVAFLQYTSGSISSPKGVIVTHANIMANEAMIEQSFRFHSDSVMVSWLPLFHDMGLIGGALQPLYSGGSVIIFAPQAFLQRPLRWWQAVSRYRATVTGGPNFAYDLSAKRLSTDPDLKLDLRSLEVAYCGAEPIQPQTLRRFVELMQPHGLSPRSILPCYGMAEATLLVSGGPAQSEPVYRNYVETSLNQGLATAAEEGVDAKLLAACGVVGLQKKIIIVAPESHHQLGDGKVGEVWLSGPNIAQGYWNRSDATLNTFQAQLAEGGDDGRYLRTGDLGFIDQGKLYITGRLKDLIIIGGRNLYPQDVETVLAAKLPQLRQGSIVAAPWATEHGEGIAIVAEVDRKVSDDTLPALVRQIQDEVFQRFETAPAGVFLLAQLGIMKTSSGKLQRALSLKAALAGNASVRYAWRHAPSMETEGNTKQAGKAPNHQRSTPKKKPANLGVAVRTTPAAKGSEGPSSQNYLPVSEAQIEAAIVARLAQHLHADASSIRAKSFAELGLESVDAMELASFVSEQFGIEVDQGAVFKNPSAAMLAAYCAARTPRKSQRSA